MHARSTPCAPTLPSAAMSKKAPQQWTVRGAGAQALAGCPLRLRPPVARCRTRALGPAAALLCTSQRPPLTAFPPPSCSLTWQQQARPRPREPGPQRSVSLAPAAQHPRSTDTAMPSPHPSDRPYPQQVKRVRCETSAAMVPKDKAIKRFHREWRPQGEAGRCRRLAALCPRPRADLWPRRTPGPTAARQRAPHSPPRNAPSTLPVAPLPLSYILSSPPSPLPHPRPSPVHTAATPLPLPPSAPPTPAAQAKKHCGCVSAARHLRRVAPGGLRAAQAVPQGLLLRVGACAATVTRRRSCGVQLARGSGGGWEAGAVGMPAGGPTGCGACVALGGGSCGEAS